MQTTHTDMMTQIATKGWAMVFGTRQLKAATELVNTGLFVMVSHSVGGVDCHMLSLKTTNKAVFIN